MKRIIICCDGTWQGPRDEHTNDAGLKVFKPSNPLKIFRAVKPLADDGKIQVSFYDEGVGNSGNFLERIDGGVFAGGFLKNIEDAACFLIANYQLGDDVYLFGFSRGAATVRSLTRFIDWAGGLPTKRDAYFLPELIDRYADSEGDASEAKKLIQEIRNRPRTHLGEFRPAPIRFLGVFDTVLAVGSRLKVAITNSRMTSNRKHQFHVGESPATCVKTARHALGIDERRKVFAAEVWKRPAFPQQSLQQRWFSGVHKNIGGGYPNDGLANFALHWMAGEAIQADLDLDEDFLKFYHPFSGDQLYESLTHIYKVRGPRSRDLDAGSEANLELHPSVFEVLNHQRADRNYIPKNLIAYLRQHPALVERVDAEVRQRLGLGS